MEDGLRIRKAESHFPLSISYFPLTFISFSTPIGIMYIAQKDGRLIYISLGDSASLPISPVNDSILKKYSVTNELPAYIKEISLKSKQGNSGHVNDSKKLMISWIQKKFPGFKIGESDNDDPENGLLNMARNQILEYFDGKRRHFNIPYKMTGTNFQKSVWREIEKIPYGNVISYSELAANAGNTKASRAAGGACGKNHLPIIIPCHRVVASDGTLGGFGGRLDLKHYLLKTEFISNRE